MRRTLALLPLGLLLTAVSARAQRLDACDPVVPDICATVEFSASGTDLWVDAYGSAAITGLTFTVPGIFASQLSSDPGPSLGSWRFDLTGGTATFGNFSPNLSGSDDAFGLLYEGLFRFALAAPLSAGDYNMSFVALSLYDPVRDGPYYMDDFVLGAGTASLSTAPEPVSLALVATGLLALVGAGAGRRKRAHA